MDFVDVRNKTAQQEHPEVFKTIVDERLPLPLVLVGTTLYQIGWLHQWAIVETVEEAMRSMNIEMAVQSAT